jgi:hypothetical protein
LLYSSLHRDPNAYLLHGHALPIWAIVYSMTLWWVIWSPTEETTYQAYALPRLEALTGRTWVAFLIVGFFGPCNTARFPSSQTGDICSSVSSRFFPESSS